MSFSVVALSVLAALIALLGFAAMVRTQVFTGLAKYFKQPWGIWVAAGIRVFAAIILWLAAPVSRFPQAFRVLAVLALVAAVLVLLIGHQRVKAMIDWAVCRPAWFLRMFGVFAVLVGGFVLWALHG
ncbi:MAG: hypothetical protein OER80_07460 [Gammaproteobacteria bacterium]|nr:hypothetical protein [Gammaproteobacteria bacterium]MDH3768652.1 hypothetical protein [Gammaproteobacteria bacterium]